jgi:hypothetical protein
MYPEIPIGVWQPAVVLADRVLAGRLLRGAESAMRGRVLEEEHFEFRGGSHEHQGVREGFRFRAPSAQWSDARL